MKRLPKAVRDAIRCGPVPRVREWRSLPIRELTRAERVMAFGERYLKVPEGSMVGRPIHLEPFQEAFIYSVFDNRVPTKQAILSMARKNSKTTTLAILILAYIIGPEAARGQNSNISSGARSRPQAALVFDLMVKMIRQNDDINSLVKIIPSAKTIRGLVQNITFHALCAEATTAVGRSDRVILLDETGQVVGPNDPFTENLISGQGAYDDAIQFVISTQAAADSDMLSVWIDDAERSGDPSTVCHVYAAQEGCDLLDAKEIARANPGLGTIRSKSDLMKQLNTAQRIPTKEAKARNLLLNQRVSIQGKWLAPRIWKENSGPIDLDVFRNNPVSLGIDLASRHDLTAAVAAAAEEETGTVHLLPFVFIPDDELEAKAMRDRAPYASWVRDGHMYAIPGRTLDYHTAARTLKAKLGEMKIEVDSVEFDRWAIDKFQTACYDPEVNFCTDAEWHKVGQGYMSMSPRCQAFENLLLLGRIRHGGHPLLTMAAANAIAVSDPTGAIKLDKSKSSQKIDPLVAAVMAVYPLSDGGKFEDSMYNDADREVIM